MKMWGNGELKTQDIQIEKMGSKPPKKGHLATLIKWICDYGTYKKEKVEEDDKEKHV
jgi:hypothetical protein